MKKNLIYGAALVALTAGIGSEAEAQAKQKQLNRVLSRCPEYSATGEGMLLKNYVFDHKGTDNLSKVFSCLYSQRGGLRYDTVDAEKGLEGMLTRLKAGPQTPEKRASIKYLQDLKGKVSENTRLISARSPSNSTYQGQSVSFLAELGKEQVTRDSANVADSVATSYERAREYADSIKAAAQGDSVYWTDSSRPPISNDSLSKLAKDYVIYWGLGNKLDSLVKKVETNKEDSEEDCCDMRLTADVFYPINKDMNLKGGAIGLRYGIFGLVGNVTSAPDTATKDLSVDLSNGRRGIGKEKETGYRSLGAAVELHSPFKWVPVFVGGGMNHATYSVEKEERIVSASGNDLRPPVVNSRSESETSRRYYGGIELKAKAIGFGAFYGQDDKKGKFAGARLSFRLNNRGRR